MVRTYIYKESVMHDMQKTNLSSTRGQLNNEFVNNKSTFFAHNNKKTRCVYDNTIH